MTLNMYIRSRLQSLLLIFNFLNNNDETFPQDRTMARKTGFIEDRNLLDQLVADGIICVLTLKVVPNKEKKARCVFMNKSSINSHMYHV